MIEGELLYVTAESWRDIPADQWPWKNFSPLEMACRGTGKVKVAVSFMDKLQALRNGLGKPMVVNSGYRSPEHNRAIGGAAGSKHMLGQAADIAMALHDPKLFYHHAKLLGFQGFGFYPETHNQFMHIDLGPPRWWGDPKPWGINPT